MASESMDLLQDTPHLFLHTLAHRIQARTALDGLQRASQWSGDLPILVLNRCWLRLRVITVEALPRELPPDLSRAAPELERYSELLEAGWPSWQAQQICWAEFGQEACQEALRRFWNAQDQPFHGWTGQRYLAFLTEYRFRFHSQRPRPLPLLVLARASGGETHGLFWLRPEPSIDSQAMRHTCA